MLSGCGGAPFSRAPSSAVAFNGQWVLDREHSDDVLKLIQSSLPVPKKPRERSDDDWNSGGGMAGGHSGGRSGGRGSRGGADGSANGSDYTSVEQAPSYGKVRPIDFVKAFVWPASGLEVQTSADLIRLNGDGRVRSLEPGSETPYSITDRYGSRSIFAGYRGNQLVIRAEDPGRLMVEETFIKDHEHLAETIKFQARGFKTITAHVQYRLATSTDQPVVLDGPPQPSAR
jgi:hypothetical protein